MATTLAAPNSTATISLYYREGSSDKVYHAQIAPKGNDLYIVEFQYGRRGSTLQSGVKTNTPVPLPQAQKVFDKLVAEKKGKGYTEGAQGTSYSGGDLANRRFDYTPQLLNFIDESTMLDYLRRPEWLMQEKMDGVRQIVARQGNIVSAGNRNGLGVAVSTAISNAVLAFGHDCVLDGEAIGDVYWPFDMLSFDGEDITHRPASFRLQLLAGLLKATPSKAFGHVRTAFTQEEKQSLLHSIRSEGGEGGVFKNAGSRYTPGRPASGGDALKHKFKGSATCSVLSHNLGKRSVLLGIRDESSSGSLLLPVTEIGNITIPVNHPLPPCGSLVEVEYLYAFRGGSLFQPVYKGSLHQTSKIVR